ncbi:MAG: hypothetical protein ACKN9T_15310, partial [Candidatus Methylumidiphilus sp.]
MARNFSEPAKSRKPTGGASHAMHEEEKTVGEWRCQDPRITCRDVGVHYGEKRALHTINIDIGRHQVLAFIGPSGCGKSTF